MVISVYSLHQFDFVMEFQCVFMRYEMGFDMLFRHILGIQGLCNTAVL